MKYKGKSVEFQRVYGKKAAKIKQMSSEEAKFNTESSKVLNENKQFFFDEDTKYKKKTNFFLKNDKTSYSTGFSSFYEI